MQKKIVWKLAACFGAALLIFTSVTCAVFIVLFQQNTVEIHRADMEQRALGVAALCGQVPSICWSGSDPETQESHLWLLDALTQADVWLVDENNVLMTHGGYTYQDLSIDVDQMIVRIFAGEVAFSENFSELLQVPTLTVGVPVRNVQGDIIGAVLLHSPIDGIDAVISQGLTIFGVSILAALLLAAVISIGISYLFTKPLHKMNAAALKLTDGDYTAKTGVAQRDEIGQLAGTMDLLAGRLGEVSQEKARLDQMRQDFVTNVSHELRTPVTVLRGSLESLRDGIVTDPAEITQYLDQMIAEIVFLERLVNDLLELSRLQNVDFNIEMLPLNLCDVMSDVARGMRRVAEQKKISISVINPYAEFWVTGDYGRIRQMLLIVLDNGVKFSHAGQTVTMELAETDTAARVLRISDAGIGIPPEELRYIFDRFRKTWSAANQGGSGLGLAIARQIANRHGIEITATSVPNGKTEFSFAFHAGPPEMPPRDQQGALTIQK